MSFSPNFRGASSTAPTTSVQNQLANNTGSTLAKATPVYANTSGELSLVNVSVEASSYSVLGLVVANILDTQKGNIIFNGKLTDVTTSAVFGDTLFVSKTGTLTNVKPTLGVGGFVSGDFVIRVGVVVKNDLDPAKKDIIIQIQLNGQL